MTSGACQKAGIRQCLQCCLQKAHVTAADWKHRFLLEECQKGLLHRDATQLSSLQWFRVLCNGGVRSVMPA